jgi:hypothetical protein
MDKSAETHIYFLLRHPKFNPSSEDLENAVRHSFPNPRILEMFLAHENFDPTVGNNFIIKTCASDARESCVNNILNHPKFDVIKDGQEVLSSEILNGSLGVVSMIIGKNKIDLSLDNEFLLIKACERGSGFARLFIRQPGLRFNIMDNEPLLVLILRGHVDEALLLLKKRCVQNTGTKKAFFNAIISGAKGPIIRALARHADILSDGVFLFECAVLFGCTEAAKILIAYNKTCTNLMKKYGSSCDWMTDIIKKRNHLVFTTKGDKCIDKRDYKYAEAVNVLFIEGFCRENVNYFEHIVIPEWAQQASTTINNLIDSERNKKKGSGNQHGKQQ